MNLSKAEVRTGAAHCLSAHLRNLCRCLLSRPPRQYDKVACDSSLGEGIQHAKAAVEIWERSKRPQLVNRCYPAQTKSHLDALYAAGLLRSILLARFELLCTSVEAFDDIEAAFGALRLICKSADEFDRHIAKPLQLGSLRRLTIADLSDVVVQTHSKRIADKIGTASSRDAVLTEAKYELGFVRAFLGTIATYTGLFPWAQKAEFVSEEMFELDMMVTWYDCLVPGAQCDTLRAAGDQLIARIWRQAATHLVSTFRGDSDKLAEIAKSEALNYHGAAVKALLQVSIVLAQQAALTEWDVGMQQMLVASQSTKYSINKAVGLTKCSEIFISQVVPSTVEHFFKLLKPPDYTCLSVPEHLASHLNTLNLTWPLCQALECSLQLQYLFMAKGLRQAMLAMNMRALTQLLFVDGPAVCESVNGAVWQCGEVSAPRAMLPSDSVLKLTERWSQVAFSSLCRSKMELEEMLETMYYSFYQRWRALCAQSLLANFPSKRQWKTIGKQDHVKDLIPSPYIRVMVEELLYPSMAAASHLPCQPQLSFLSLVTSTLVAEIRRAITNNKQVYRPPAGRQLLVDCRYIAKCFQSTNVQLDPAVTSALQSLPGLDEMEEGLLLLCGTPSRDTRNPTMVLSNGPNKTVDLELATERSWYTSSDWTACID